MKKDDMNKPSQENDNVNSVNDMTDEIQDIDYDLVTSGPLYFDKSHIKPGYVPAFVADVPGQVEMYKRWGYQVVLDQFKVGSSTAASSSQFGSAVTVQSKCGQLLVLMAIKKELHDRLMAHKDKKSAERTSSLGKIEGVDERYQTFNGKPMGEFRIK